MLLTVIPTVSESEGEDSTIIIDSEDDMALERSTLITRRQTFTFSVRRKTTYIAGQEVTTNTTKKGTIMKSGIRHLLLSAGVSQSAIISYFCTIVLNNKL